MWASMMLAADAPITPVAWIEERECDTVSLPKRPTEGICINAITQRMNYTCEFVTSYAPHRTLRTIPIPTPTVQIRAANYRVSVLDQ